ncbi:MAG: gliding motility-associated C-terminal domain-containing protein [Ginsengibacter sp.]
MRVKSFIVIFLLLLSGGSHAQTCTTLGQTPSTAFPVCGTTTFKQIEVPVCNSNSLYVPGCSGNGGANYANKNPFWYKFTCYVSGTLGFEITPNNMQDDYDWQLYDITGLDPDQVYSNHNIIVTGNWAGNPGTTGTSANGVNFIQCASGYNGSEPRFAKMPNLRAGHEYILLVSHFTDSQSGYSLSFGGGTASITDTTQPALKSVEASCDATKLYVKLNKNMKCSSLAAGGSDFAISFPGTTVISATAACTGFDMDSLVVELSNPLPPGNYTLSVKNGTDSNTIIDNCGTNIPEGDSLLLTIYPLMPTPMDSLTTPTCAPQFLQLVFKKNILCTSVAPDGSDFIVTGPSSVDVVSAVTNCNSDVTRIITINLSTPMAYGGNYQLKLKTGNDGNTLLDECTQQTPEGATISFTLQDTVSADFTYNILKGCKENTVQFEQDGRHGITKWSWQLDYSGPSTLQNPVTKFELSGTKQIKLLVSNGFCSDTALKEMVFDNALKAAFETSNLLCPEDSAVFKNTSLGKIASYEWNFGNGFTNLVRDPLAQKYPVSLGERNYQVSLIIKNDIGCYDTAIHTIKILKSCYIAVPNAFTPNGDGLNDYLYPLNAYKANNLKFRIYTRLGQLLYQSNDWTQKWDGTVNGEPQDAGVYVWTLQYILRDTGKPVFKKGSVILIR